MERGAEDLGEWGLVVRVVADWDPARVHERLLWSLRDLLLAYLAILRRDALERYQHDLAVWATLAPHQKSPGSPPKPPRILKS
jgi:hypothetical protein